jgi:hypothetical protein
MAREATAPRGDTAGMDAAALIVIGTALLAVSWLCWTGRWRAWAHMAVLPVVGITLLPGLGLCLLLSGAGLAIGGGGRVLIGIGLLASLAGFVLAMWDPAWYGPRWFRDLSRRG